MICGVGDACACDRPACACMICDVGDAWDSASVFARFRLAGGLLGEGFGLGFGFGFGGRAGGATWPADITRSFISSRVETVLHSFVFFLR